MSLHYGDPQIAIGVVFAVLALLARGAFVVIGVQAGSECREERVHQVGYWLRKRWLALLLVIGVLVVGISLFDLPYASGSAAGRTVVKVTGGQFFWSLVAGPGAGGDARPLRRHLGRRQPRLRPLRPARPPDRLGAGDARLPQQARPDADRGRRLPDPLPRALRPQPLDDGGHVHGDAALMEAAVRRRSRVLHPRAAAFTVEARGVERRIGLLFAATGIALVAVMGVLGLIMRLTQATVIGLSPAWFYRLMTLHGAGMITGACSR